MEQYVDGEEWVARGWMSVLQFLYEDDVTIELSHVKVPEELSEDEYEVIESLSQNSALLEQTGLTEAQALTEFRYLRKENLVHYVQPFEDSDFVVYRLTDTGFKVAHEMQRTQKDDEWRSQNKQINVILTIATALLAATAFIQAILSIMDFPYPTNIGLAVIYLVAIVLSAGAIIGWRGGQGPDLWGKANSQPY